MKNKHGCAICSRPFLLLLLLALIPFAISCARHPYELTADDRKIVEKALKEDDPAALQQLLQKGMDANSAGGDHIPYIVRATEAGSSDIVRALLNAHANPDTRNAEGKTLLIIAVEKKYTDLIEALLRWTADINATQTGGPNDGATALMRAVEGGNPEIVKSLLEKRPDVNIKDKQGRTVLSLATQKGNADILAALKQAGAK